MSQIEGKKREALKISIKEGSFANAATGFGDSYMTPAILAVNGTANHVGIFNAISGIAGPLAQIWGNKFQEKYSNKRIVLKSVILQIILWAVTAVVVFFAPLFGAATAIGSFLLLFTGIITLGGILSPAFFSWMGDLVRKDERGKYFSKRGAIIGVVGLVATIVASIMLDFFRDIREVLLGFAILFILTAAFRCCSYYFLRKQYEPQHKNFKLIQLPWKNFLSMKSRIGRFTMGMTAFNFALMVASPFIAVYLLQERGYSYFVYTAVIMANAGWNLVFLPLVGKFSDKYGNASLLNLAGFLFTISPPMWIFINNPIILILVPQLLNGIANAAFNIGFSNYIYANMPVQTRSTTVAHVNVLAGVGVVAGSLLGGYLLTALQNIPNIFLLVFLLATISRGAVSMLFLSKLRDMKSSRSKMLHFDIIHPLRTMQHDARIVKNLLEK